MRKRRNHDAMPLSGSFINVLHSTRYSSFAYLILFAVAEIVALTRGLFIVILLHIYINCLILLLQFTGITCNGTIMYMFYKAKLLKKNPALRLLLFVAISDFLFASSSLPYSIYLTAFTITPPINLSPHYIMFSSIPLTVQLKLKLILTAAIALQRTLALFLPLLYRKQSSSSYSVTFLLFGISFGCIDLFLEFALSPLVEKPNCATVVCFVSEWFRDYWGTSNMVLGLFTVVFTAMILFKLRSMEKLSGSEHARVKKEGHRFNQANRTSAGMLLSSLLFIIMPSVCVGFVEMIGYSISRRLGPFYTFGLLCAGTCNGIVYVVLNQDMRAVFRSFFSEPAKSVISIHLIQSRSSTIK